MSPVPACVCVLCGLPAAGKSRLAQQLRGHVNGRGWRTLIVTYDELIPARDWRQAEWKQHRKTLLMCLERFLSQTHTLSDVHTHSLSEDQTHFLADGQTNSLSDGQTHTEADTWMRFKQLLQHQGISHSHTQPLILLLDDNFYYQSMRQQIQQLARKYAVGFCQVFLQCPLQVCVQRNRLRPHPVPDAVLLQMCERMEPPDPSRNTWERLSLTLDSTADTDVKELLDLLASALETPLKPVQDVSQQKEADRQICASSALHQADQMCRRVVSQAVAAARESQASSEMLQALAKHLNEMKTAFLQDLKKDVICREEPVDLQELLTDACVVFERRALEAVNTHTHT